MQVWKPRKPLWILHHLVLTRKLTESQDLSHWSYTHNPTETPLDCGPMHAGHRNPS